MEIIDELENRCGAASMPARSAISATPAIPTPRSRLRTLLIKNNRVYIQAGGGVVADSDPAAEFEESVNKARAMIRALSAAREFETAARAVKPMPIIQSHL